VTSICDELRRHCICEKGTRMSKTEHFNTERDGNTGYRLAIQRLLIGLLLALVGCMTLSTSASAQQVRLFSGSFGGASSTPANPYPLSISQGVAVDDASHDVYVTDLLNHRVEKFGPSGEFILLFGKEVNLTKVLAAAPEAEQNVCAASSFDTCQAGALTSSPGGFEYPRYIAVDNSSGESKGDVYVANTALSGESTIADHVVSKFDSSGNLISSWASKGQLDGSNATGAVKGPFGPIEGMAVDASGNVWVVDQNRQMFEFRPNSSFVTGWKMLEPQTADGDAGIAVDSEDNLYTGTRATKFDSTGLEIGSVLGAEWAPEGFAVDSNELYIDVASPGGSAIQRYDASCHPARGFGGNCTPVESFGSAHLESSSGLAIDPSTSTDTLYVANKRSDSEVASFSVETVPDVSTLKATAFTSTSAILNGSVNPSGVELKTGLEGCRFEWGETEIYGHVSPCDENAAQIGSGSNTVEVRAPITGLQQGKTYHFRLVAGNANDVNSLIDEPSQGQDLAFGPPLIENGSAIGVAASRATIQAQVNPNNVDTQVRVEYGNEAGTYANSTPETDVGSSGTSELASFQLSGLAPHITYHYRVVAENALGEGTGAILSSDHTFLTQTGASDSVLPDGRGWELVSPPDKHGAELVPIFETGGVQASVAGDAISFMATAPTEAEPAGNSNKVQILSRRTPSGWGSQGIAIPHDASTGVPVGNGQEYRLFSSDLSLGIVQPFGGFVSQISAEASEQTPYLRTDYPTSDVNSPCLASCYRPLVTGTSGYANVPSETVFAPTCETSVICGPEFVGASPDLNHVVLQSAVPLTEGAPVGTSGEGSLYEWSGGRITLVSVLPDGELAPTNSNPLFGENRVARNAVSTDGSRIVWSSSGSKGERLYVRDTAREETVQVGSGAVQFQTASSDNSKILFTEGDEEHGDLRECDIVEHEGTLSCEYTDLTPVGVGENAGVLRTVPGASEDASYVYFVANAALKNGSVVVQGAQPGGCGGFAVANVRCNLYVRHNGATKLVAELSGEDGPDWGRNGSGLVGLTARISPDGRWLAFMSDRSLTGYDNRDGVTGRLDEEVYLYDASANDGVGALVCASCDPTGARPHGTEYTRLESGHGGLAFGSVGGFEQDQGIAANVPGWTPFRLGEALYQSRYLSDDGRLFFDSSDALVPQDSNGTGDVYEYEPPGIGDCQTASATFSEVSDGCVGLISSGTSKEESGFVDASEDGDDVFFLTYAQLSHADTDSIRDIYDARVGGGFVEASPLPVCEGDACQSPVGASEDPTPGSLTYSGPGNLSTSPPVTIVSKHKARPLTRAQKLAKALAGCKRDKSKTGRNRCVRSARKRFGQAKAGRANAKKGKR
jgi:hypothetical protein